MAITKTKIAALASTVCAAGSTLASPGADSGTIDLTGKYGADLHWSLTNGSSAPGVAPTLLVSASADGTTWYTYAVVGGDTTASSVNSGTIWIDQGIMYARVRVYGNTTNSVTAQSDIAAITGV
jgi:hypothetical protein